MSRKGEISTPMNTPIGKTPTGAQNQGNAIDVLNYAKLNEGLAGGTTIATEMDCPIGHVPKSGERDGI